MASNKSQKLQLVTQQCRLRHLCSICARNIKMSLTQFKVLTKNAGNLGYYFTLHVKETTDAFYTSELLNGSETDFNWKSFNWPSQMGKVDLSLAKIHIKIFATCTNSDEDQEIIFQNFCFKEMQYLGEQIPKNGHSFRPNTILFEMFSGFYIGCESSINIHPISANKVLATRPKEIFVAPEYLRNSYDFSTLKRVHTVERAVRQTRVSVQKVQSIIQKELANTEETMQKLSAKEYLINKINILRDELENQNQQLQNIQKNCIDLKSKNQQKSSELTKLEINLNQCSSKLFADKHNFIDNRENLLKTVAQLNIIKRHQISELSFIFPVQQNTDKTYSICGVTLPDSESFVGKDETMLSVALGYVCHLIMMISLFLNIPLRYPTLYMGTRSRIYDYFLSSISDSEREFPLFCRGSNKMHFNYGVYLLNKNISQLRFHCGIGTQDLRMTLLNVKALLELRQVSKIDSVTVPVNIEKNASLIKRFPHLIEDAGESSDSLPTEDSKHRAALWKSSPEHSRSGTLSLSLDQGLDEIVRENNFKKKLKPNNGEENYNCGAISQTPAELHLSEPFLTDVSDSIQTNNGMDKNEVSDAKSNKKIWLPLQIYASESDGEFPVHIVKDSQTLDDV